MRILLMLLVSGSLLVLSACGATTSTTTASLDQQFIDMMVPHHEGAVEMAKIAQQRAERPEITQMAEAIVRDQNREIARMKEWRMAWFGSDQTPPLDKMPMLPGAMPGHDMGGATMNMAADVEKLRAAGNPFDKAFIDAMIPHHQSAIEAAKVAQEQAQRTEIKQLAGEIIAEQQREIEQMRQWRQAWYGSATPEQ